MDLKLKPCPFCGERGKVRNFKDGYRIVCGGCGATSLYAHIKPWHDNKFVAQCQAAKAWNSRSIVRCKECKHLYFKDFSAFCPYRSGPCSPDGFCDCGEKKPTKE